MWGRFYTFNKPYFARCGPILGIFLFQNIFFNYDSPVVHSLTNPWLVETFGRSICTAYRNEVLLLVFHEIMALNNVSASLTSKSLTAEMLITFKVSYGVSRRLAYMIRQNVGSFLLHHHVKSSLGAFLSTVQWAFGA